MVTPFIGFVGQFRFRSFFGLVKFAFGSEKVKAFEESFFLEKGDPFH